MDLCCCCLLFFQRLPKNPPPTSKILESPGEIGATAFKHGDFENALLHWSNEAKDFADKGQTSDQINALIQLAGTYQALGQNSASITALNEARTLAYKSRNVHQQISVLNSLGAAHTAMGEYQKAKGLLGLSADKAKAVQATGLLAATLNNQGNLLTLEGKFTQAIKSYAISSRLALSSGYPKLAQKSSVNAAIAASKTRDKGKIKTTLQTAKEQLATLADDHDKAFSWITLSQIAQRLATKHTHPSQWQSFTYHALQQAITIGEQLSDVRAISYGKGYLGQLYLAEGRFDEALQLTRQAIFVIENNNAPELLFRWQWQTGRIFKKQGNSSAAISAYQQAISTLQPVRQYLSSQQHSVSSFREEIEPLYLELADLLLQSNDLTTDKDKIQRNLRAARTTMEQLKAAELEDYFNDDCVSALQQKMQPLDIMGQHTAAIYPILFAERTEILLSLPDGLKRFTIPVSRADITKEVRLFRHNLENRTTREYLLQAQKLYQWLISPLQATLEKQKVNTLILVPEESLRTIPMAALHDGQAFLIEKYAIANTPGLNLIDPKPLASSSVKVLAIGLTEAVQGFPALPHVASELANVNKTFGGQILQDEQFKLNSVQDELKQNNYNIVHIASHGQFKSDSQENFVLTFEDKLSMNNLEQLIGLSRFRNNPVELLTLSACQTAAGDDRAALGLAGIAVKAGARSAVATLWFINDQAAADLVSEFYRQLKKTKSSKAQALKNAQVHLIKETPYSHPYFWSPFLLIGNWL